MSDQNANGEHGNRDPSREEPAPSLTEDRIDPQGYAWPAAQLDPVERMRALAAGLSYAAEDETVFDVDFDRVWSFISDFEGNTKRFEGAVSRARILDHTEDRIRLQAKGPIGGPWIDFSVVLRPGWCLMKSRFGDVGMAARPESEGRTRFFHFEGSRLLGRIVRPVFAWNIRQDFRRLRALL